MGYIATILQILKSALGIAEKKTRTPDEVERQKIRNENEDAKAEIIRRVDDARRD